MSGEDAYRAAVASLSSALTFGIHPSLDGIKAIVAALGNPQDTFASVQVTGTNGKSSTTRLATALLRAHGMRTGCYTSPHLIEYTERMEIDGEPISPAAFAHAVSAAVAASARAAAGATEFELLTAAALWAFREARVDVAVLEVGMGGRWDATSVVAPAVSVITGVSLDHTAHLGATREAIAADKAYIIKPASAPVLGPGTEGVERIFIERAEHLDTHPRAVREFGAASPLAEEMTVRYLVVERPDRVGGVTRMDVRGLHGMYEELAVVAPTYQAANVAMAIAAAEAALGRALDPGATRAALAVMTFPARFEVFAGDPLVVLDGSHNPEAARVLAHAIAEEFGETRPRVLLGVLADKDAAGIVSALAPVAGEWAVTTPDSPRALGADALAAVVSEVTGQDAGRYPDVASALETLVRRGAGPLVIAGSLMTAGEARRWLLARRG